MTVRTVITTHDFHAKTVTPITTFPVSGTPCHALLVWHNIRQ